MTLNEARSALRDLTKWSEAIGRLQGVLTVATALEADEAAYEQKRRDLVASLDTLHAEHDAQCQALVAEREAAVAALEKHTAWVTQTKADLDEEVAAARADAEAVQRRHKEQSAHVMASLQAERASLSQRVEDARVVHQAELTAMAAEREKLAQDLHDLRTERARLLEKFAVN